MADKKNQGNRLYNFFSRSSNKLDKGVTKDKISFDGKYNLKNFFKFLKFRFGDITVLNLIFFILNFSLILMLLSLSGIFYDYTATPSTTLYQQLYGAMQYGGTDELNSLTVLYGISTNLSVPTVASKVLLYSGFTLFLTFGFTGVGMAYITRGFVRREFDLMIWKDFWHAIRKNFKQALPMGIIDLAAGFLISYALLFYGYNNSTFTVSLFFWFTVIFAAIYFIMRMYCYLIMITFDLSIRKIIKNSFLFTLLGIKRNICAVLGIALVFFLNFFIINLLPGVGVILPFIFTVGLMYFIGAYCVWPVIDKYMIKPYYPDKPSASEETEPVFTDRG